MAEGTRAGIDKLRTLFVSKEPAAPGGDEEEGGSGPALGLV